MATSGTYTVTYTANELVKAALRKIGAIDTGETVGSQPMADGIEALNMILFQFRGGGNIYTPSMRMWTRERASLTLSGSISFDLQPTGGDLDIQIPEEILSVLIRNSDDTDSILESMTLEQFEAISDKTAEGTPTRYYYEKRLDKGVLYFDFIPETLTDTCEIVYRQPIEVITGSANEIDCEPHWRRPLVMTLAVDLFPEYYRTQVPADLVELKEQSLRLAQTFQPETTNLHFEVEIDS